MDKSSKNIKSQVTAQGAFILSELNDIKRTIEACAQDINWNQEIIQSIIEGNSDQNTINQFIEACASFYPINKNNLVLPESDCEKGIRIFRYEDSVKSTRIFKRTNKNGEKTPYYEYRDTVMSKFSSFRPEWIKQLRYVEDNNPYNPDVIYNNGHFMHQVTFFVGPVNFYYEENGIKYCVEMNTGDSNYITPFYPHSFATRDKSQEAYIVAVTFGANVKRALKELYQLGLERSSLYVLNLEDRHKATQDLLDYHLANNRMTRKILEESLKERGHVINTIDPTHSLSEADLHIIAEQLNIDALDLIPYTRKGRDKVVVKLSKDSKAYAYPSKHSPFYNIQPLASTPEMPLIKSFHLQILKEGEDFTGDFQNGLHTYVFNYCPYECEFSWKFKTEVFHETLCPGDSLYIQPFIDHQFNKKSPNDLPELYCVSIPGEITLETQKELSRLKDIERTVFESKCWFN